MENNSQSRSRNFEVIFYCVVLILAFGLRFIKLGALPMGDLEATNALQAAKIAGGEAVTVGGQPGYVILTSILFFIFGKTEFWARFWAGSVWNCIGLIAVILPKMVGENTGLNISTFLCHCARFCLPFADCHRNDDWPGKPVRCDGLFC